MTRKSWIRNMIDARRRVKEKHMLTLADLDLATALAGRIRPMVAISPKMEALRNALDIMLCDSRYPGSISSAAWEI